MYQKETVEESLLNMQEFSSCCLTIEKTRIVKKNTNPLKETSINKGMHTGWRKPHSLNKQRNDKRCPGIYLLFNIEAAASEAACAGKLHLPLENGNIFIFRFVPLSLFPEIQISVGGELKRKKESVSFTFGFLLSENWRKAKNFQL